MKYSTHYSIGLVVAWLMLVVFAFSVDYVKANKSVTSGIKDYNNHLDVIQYDSKWQDEINRRVIFCYEKPPTIELVHQCLWDAKVWI